MVVHPGLGGAVGLEIEVADDVICGDGCKPIGGEADGVIGGGVGDAVKERHELEERGFICCWSGHNGFLWWNFLYDKLVISVEYVMIYSTWCSTIPPVNTRK